MRLTVFHVEYDANNGYGALTRVDNDVAAESVQVVLRAIEKAHPGSRIVSIARRFDVDVMLA